MTELSPFFFYLFSSVAIACSMLMVFKKSPIASAFNLVLVFFCIAGLFAMMGAHLLAALQIIVSTGAVMVLFIFVIMLLGADVPTLDLKQTNKSIKIIAGVFISLIGILMIVLFKNTSYSGPKGPYTNEAIMQAGGNTQVLARVMFTEYILPLQIVGILLLAGIIGSVGIAMRKKKGAHQ
jgi:NADH-quinone oxidoreductase subunit J